MAIVNLPSLSSSGVTSNITSMQSATILAWKFRFLVDDMSAITFGNTTTVFQLGSTAGGNVIKLAMGIGNNGTGVSSMMVTCPGFGGNNFNVTNSALPASGSYVSCYGWWDNAAGTQGLFLYSATGTLLGSNTKTSYFPGALPTSTNTGVLAINKGNFDAGTDGSGILHLDGLAFYSLESTVTAFQWAQPVAGDADRLLYFNFDEGIGTTSTDVVGSNVLTWTLPTWLTGGIWDPGTTVNAVGQQYAYILGTPLVQSNTTQVFATGQQENYQQPGGVAGVDIAVYPTTQVYAWLTGTATVSILNNQNIVINPSSQVYHWLTGIPTLALTTLVTAIGQQINWQIGHPVIQTSTSATVTAIGQQYAYLQGNILVQIISGNNPIVIVPEPGSGFVIEGCPKVDTMMTIESDCGQSTTAQMYRYDGVLKYDGTHAYGAF
jgi:hypothetical protein